MGNAVDQPDAGFIPPGFCPRCDYATSAGICPECGYDVPLRKLRRHPRSWLRRRARLLTLTTVVTLSAGAYVGTRPGLVPYMPTWYLLARHMLNDNYANLASLELSTRCAAGKLSRIQATLFARFPWNEDWRVMRWQSDYPETYVPQEHPIAVMLGYVARSKARFDAGIQYDINVARIDLNGTTLFDESRPPDNVDEWGSRSYRILGDASFVPPKRTTGNASITVGQRGFTIIQGPLREGQHTIRLSVRYTAFAKGSSNVNLASWTETHTLLFDPSLIPATIRLNTPPPSFAPMGAEDVMFPYGGKVKFGGAIDTYDH